MYILYIYIYYINMLYTFTILKAVLELFQYTLNEEILFYNNISETTMTKNSLR